MLFVDGNKGVEFESSLSGIFQGSITYRVSEDTMIDKQTVTLDISILRNILCLSVGMIGRKQFTQLQFTSS